MLRNRPLLGDVARPQRARPFEAFVPLLSLVFAGDVDELMDGPRLLEAVLTAEVRGVKVHLFAGGTEHGG